MSATTHDDAHGREHHDRQAQILLLRWLCSTNHKDIGTLYIGFAVIGGLMGGILSEVMRAQLQFPGNHIVKSGQEWNTIITSHGLLMIFSVMPALIRRLRQLVRAADDRRARHGLPAPQQHQLLAAAAGFRADHDRSVHG